MERSGAAALSTSSVEVEAEERHDSVSPLNNSADGAEDGAALLGRPHANSTDSDVDSALFDSARSHQSRLSSMVGSINSISSTGSVRLGSVVSSADASAGPVVELRHDEDAQFDPLHGLEEPLFRVSLAPPGASVGRRRQMTRGCLGMALLCVGAASLLLWRLVWVYYPDGTLVALPGGQGELQGLVTSMRTREFRGVPFAAPPTGSRRWLPPQEHGGWEGVRDAVEHEANCVQTDILGLGWAWPSLDGGLPSAEDCLYLTIYAPRLSRVRGVFGTEQLPVMVYVHGGANLNGGSDDRQLNGAHLADNLNVVVVVPNYRLGIFGYLGSELLRARNGSVNTTGNYAQQDQRRALRWVSDNIAAFGGDPARVLLFGESTGSGAVAVHLVGDTYHAAGATLPFRAAAMQSGAMQPWVAKTMPEAEAVFGAVLTRLGCPAAEGDGAAALECLLAQSASALFNASYAAEPGDLPFGDSWYSCQWAPVVDGVELSDTPAALLVARGAPAGVSALIGSNRDEGTQSLYTDGGASYQPVPKTLNESGFEAWASAEWGNRSAEGVELYRDEPVAPGSSPNISRWWWAASRAVGDMLCDDCTIPCLPLGRC